MFFHVNAAAPHGQELRESCALIFGPNLWAGGIMAKRQVASILSLALLCGSLWAAPYTLPPTVSAGERLASERASPGLDYNDPVPLVCPGRDEVRSATIKVNPDVLLDVYWPAGEIASPLPIVLFIVELPRSRYLDSVGKPFRKYVPVVSWAADIAARGMIAVVPDPATPRRDYPLLLDWLEVNGSSLGMDPKRQAYFCPGYACAFLPFVAGLPSSNNVKALVLYYGAITPEMGLRLRPDIALLWAKVGMGSYLTKHYPAMVKEIQAYKDQGNPVEIIDMPNSYPYFDWKQLDAESASVLERTLVFLENHLR